MSAWTPGPWSANKARIEVAGKRGFRGGNYRVADAYFSSGLADTPLHEQAVANAARIVACVNAMEGIADPQAFVELAKAAGVR